MAGERSPEKRTTNGAWNELCAAASDITAWCNDIYSLAREQANNESTNYVTVLRHAHSLAERDAIEQVTDRITRRLHNLRKAEGAVLASM
ncbi:terpene synthase family protein [Streptomyces sp. NPDC046870]|uniref:terpene synthase family protein n=1 Tax=Streptomyces sp. NPDC046870 TaxID=3155135 RepID=UPI003455DD82